MKTLKLHYSEALIRKAIWAFWLRVTGWRFLLAVSLVLASFVYSVASGDRSWWVGVSASIIGLAAIFTVTLYVVHYRGATTRFRRMQSPLATFEVGDDRFRVTSDIGSSELLWGAITEIWQFSEFWLLFLSRTQFITLPLENIDSKTQTFILSRAKVHGAKIT